MRYPDRSNGECGEGGRKSVKRSKTGKTAVTSAMLALPASGAMHICAIVYEHKRSKGSRNVEEGAKREKEGR